MNSNVSKLLNEQINKEFYSAYLYLDMSNYYYGKNLDGFGNWFKIQAQEERDHAMLFLTYLQNNGECPKLSAIEAPNIIRAFSVEVLYNLADALEIRPGELLDCDIYAYHDAGGTL